MVVALAIAVVDFAVWLRWPYPQATPWNLDLTHWPQVAGLFALGALAGACRVLPTCRPISALQSPSAASNTIRAPRTSSAGTLMPRIMRGEVLSRRPDRPDERSCR